MVVVANQSFFQLYVESQAGHDSSWIFNIYMTRILSRPAIPRKAMRRPAAKVEQLFLIPLDAPKRNKEKEKDKGNRQSGNKALTLPSCYPPPVPKLSPPPPPRSQSQLAPEAGRPPLRQLWSGGLADS